MAKGDVITRKEIIEDEALNWGPEYAKQIQTAIKANEEFKKGIFDIISAQKGIKGSTNNSKYLEEKEKERLAFQKNIQAIREQEAAEKSALKIRQETARTIKAEIDAQNKIASSKKRNTQLTIEERVAQQAENKALRDAALEKLGLTGAYTKLNRERTNAARVLRDLIASEKASEAEIKKAQSEFDRLDAKVRKADHAVRDFTKNVGNYPTIGKLAGGVRELAGAFGIAAGTAAFASLMKNATKVVKEFDQSIADLRAITGASGKDLEYFKKQAIDLGKDTKGGAKAVVEAYKLIASAKPELLENAQALNSVTKAAITLSKASGLELPDAATRLTDAMNQFGAPAEEAAFFIDALANGAKYGSAEIPEVTDALLKFGAVAKSSNISIGESTALIELLAEKGLKGAEAGTALRNVLLKISAPDALPKEAQQYLERLGISMETLKDKSIPVQQRLEALKPILEDDAAAVKVFGAENVVAAKNILANTDRLAELTSKMDEFGTATEQAEIRMNTLEGKTEKLNSTYDSLILSMNEGSGVVSKFFSFFVDGAQGALESLIRLNTSWEDLFTKSIEEGTEKGKETYQRKFREIFTPGISDEKEVAEQIGQQAYNLIGVYQKKLAEIQEKIDNGTGIKWFGIEVGESRDLLKEKEKLSGFLAEQNEIFEQANNELSGFNKKTNSTITESEKDLTKLTEEELKAREKARQEYLKRLQKLDNDANALALFRLEEQKEISKEISENENESIDDRIDAYLYANQLEIAIAQETAIQKLKNISRYTDDVRDLTDDEIQVLIDGGQIKKKLTDDEVLVLEEYAKKQKEIDKKTVEEKKKIVDSIVALEKKKVDATLQKQGTDLNNSLASENSSFANDIANAQGNAAEIERITLEHEERIFNIKKEYAKKALQEQINSIESLLQNENISAEERAKIENDLSKYKLQLTELDLQKYEGYSKRRIELEKQAAEITKELQNELSNTLKDLLYAVFDAKISSIDNEMQYWDNYYSEQQELAGEDQRQKDLIQKEASKKRKQLEKERQKEELKAAIAKKILAASEIGIDLAKTLTAINLAAAQLDAISFGTAGTPYRAIQIPLAIGVATAQSALVLAQPLPKYKGGRKGGPAEFAEVGDGFVHEVIEKPDGSAYLTPNYPTLTFLGQGDTVHSSVDDYFALQKASMMTSLANQGRQISDYEAMKLFDNTYSKELLDELKRNTKAVEKNKTTTVNNNIPDINHELWKLHFGKFNS